jgi:hypothetical protein
MKRLIGWLQKLLPYVIPLALVLIVVVLVLPNTSPLQNGIVENTFQNIVVPIDLPTLTPLPPPTAQSSICSGFRSEMVLSAITDSDSDIFLISSEDGKLCNLTLNPASDQFVGWSPDRQYIAFISNRDSHSDDLFDVYIVKADGSHTQRVSPESEKLVNFFGLLTDSSCTWQLIRWPQNRPTRCILQIFRMRI